MHIFQRWLLVVLILLPTSILATVCENRAERGTQVFWGDMHVHTAYSLDAYSFGTLNSPREAYAFAKGKPLTMADGSVAKLRRPLDFVAVTDHAEWFDFMYLCTDPGMSDHPDCQNLRTNSSPNEGINLFRQYVVPSITEAAPKVLAPCEGNEAGCFDAYVTQWHRVQAQAHEANEPCDFTSFVAYEWSSTKSFRHTHRNVIFASDRVPDEAFDYIRYPELQQLFRLLDANCRPVDGCDVITIPHNTNMGDGTTFDVEFETDRDLALRSQFERLIEIHQEKGNSECLSPLGATDESDCDFEIRLNKQTRPVTPAEFNSAEWEHMRAAYGRGLLLRGLRSYLRSGDQERNPLQMGFIGSTDNHAATPGFVEERDWHGPVFGLGSLDAAMSRLDWNPGGLMAIRAQQNTREDLFAAMKRREVYATSGPRIDLNFEASDKPLTCERQAPAQNSMAEFPMGSEIKTGQPFFRITASKDRAPIQQIEVIKGTINRGIFEETVVSVFEGESDAECIAWQDPNFSEGQTAFWYARVREVPTPRWSGYQCQAADLCDEFEGADVKVQERAWSSPIWYLPPFAALDEGQP